MITVTTVSQADEKTKDAKLWASELPPEEHPSKASIISLRNQISVNVTIKGGHKEGQAN